jgi:hypothetical protein
MPSKNGSKEATEILERSMSKSWGVIIYQVK